MHGMGYVVNGQEFVGPSAPDQFESPAEEQSAAGQAYAFGYHRATQGAAFNPGQYADSVVRAGYTSGYQAGKAAMGQGGLAGMSTTTIVLLGAVAAVALFVFMRNR